MKQHGDLLAMLPTCHSPLGVPFLRVDCMDIVTLPPTQCRPVEFSEWIQSQVARCVRVDALSHVGNH